MDNFFANAFSSAEDKEAMYKAIIMNTDSEEAAEIRNRYYSTRFKSMGKDVRIGVGVKIVNPQYISIGNNVLIDDHATLIARGPGGISIGSNNHINDRAYLDTEREEG